MKLSWVDSISQRAVSLFQQALVTSLSKMFPREELIDLLVESLIAIAFSLDPASAAALRG